MSVPAKIGGDEILNYKINIYDIIYQYIRLCITTAALLVSMFSLFPEFALFVSPSCDVIFLSILAFIIALFLSGAPENTKIHFVVNLKDNFTHQQYVIFNDFAKPNQWTILILYVIVEIY